MYTLDAGTLPAVRWLLVLHLCQFIFSWKGTTPMLEFGTQPERSRWLQSHRVSMHTFDRKDQILSYVVLEDITDPEIPLFFGYDPQKKEYFVSESTSTDIRQELALFEHERNLFCQGKSYTEALRQFKCPPNKRDLFITTLGSFFTAILSLMDETQHERYAPKEDIAEAIKLLDSYRKKPSKAA